MVNLHNRSYKPELLDANDIPFTDIRQNMKELDSINRLLGGHAITVKGMSTLLKTAGRTNGISVCEIGCGGGDNLNAIATWCSKNNISATFTGIDIKEECIGFARSQYPNLNARWITADYADIDFTGNRQDIIFSSLFCHHFTEDQLTATLTWMHQNSHIGFFINDLHRHPVAYYAIRWLTTIFSKSYLVRHDAPLSVARGFRKKEWESIFEHAGISGFSINWKWAFRHLIVYRHD